MSRRRLGVLALGALVAVGTALAMLAAVEVGAFATLRWLAWRAAARPLPEAGSSAYRGQPWAEAFWREQRQVLAFEYQPFGLWRARPFRGATINVDETGVRRTHHSRCDGDGYTLYVFGGSTVWGYGSPDWATIPSFLASRFEETGRPACVVNYGEDSWRSGQGVVKLLLELRARPRRPDLVVFLSGCNDVLTPAFLTGRVDVEWDFVRTKGWLETLLRAPSGGLGYLGIANTVTLARRLATRFRRPVAPVGVADAERLAGEIADDYLRSLRVVRALAAGFGFRTVFFWQPMSVTERKPLTPEEEAGTRRQLGSGYALGRAVAERTSARVRAADQPGLDYIADVFNDYPGDAYLDACHLVPEGNRRVAVRMFEVLRAGGV